ncbi:hypothetical protein HU200_064481 [Digitaria exilis]|uniref:Uncharacterized protein n=1 Tax=Digitaria exilis TaxID=1010633 RepID=A0A834ZZZ1_9POAL|nr:hypothetical protein HU200_064481 [Digitaria exilis]
MRGQMMTGKTSYPARLQCGKGVVFSLAENQFRNAIVSQLLSEQPQSPWPEASFFKFELDHAQTHVLMDMFTSISPPNNFWMPPAAAPANDHLIDVVKELSGRIELMEKKQAWSNKEVKHLQGVNERLLKRILELKGTVKTLNSKIDPLTLDDSLNQFVEQCLGSEDVIYLVGGFDGFSFLPSLDSFSPSLDILTPLKPMAAGKSYASTVALDGKIFVLGGGDGACWFDTVDKEPTYARKEYDEFFGLSDVCHLVFQRFALAGVALNGVIYAVGGFNGVQYLRCCPLFLPVFCT